MMQKPEFREERLLEAETSPAFDSGSGSLNLKAESEVKSLQSTVSVQSHRRTNWLQVVVPIISPITIATSSWQPVDFDKYTAEQRIAFYEHGQGQFFVPWMMPAAMGLIAVLLLTDRIGISNSGVYRSFLGLRFKKTPIGQTRIRFKQFLASRESWLIQLFSGRKLLGEIPFNPTGGHNAQEGVEFLIANCRNAEIPSETLRLPGDVHLTVIQLIAGLVGSGIGFWSYRLGGRIQLGQYGSIAQIAVGQLPTLLGLMFAIGALMKLYQIFRARKDFPERTALLTNAVAELRKDRGTDYPREKHE